MVRFKMFKSNKKLLFFKFQFFNLIDDKFTITSLVFLLILTWVEKWFQGKPWVKYIIESY